MSHWVNTGSHRRIGESLTRYRITQRNSWNTDSIGNRWVTASIQDHPEGENSHLFITEWLRTWYIHVPLFWSIYLVGGWDPVLSMSVLLCRPWCGVRQIAPFYPWLFKRLTYGLTLSNHEWVCDVCSVYPLQKMTIISMNEYQVYDWRIYQIRDRSYKCFIVDQMKLQKRRSQDIEDVNPMIG